MSDLRKQAPTVRSNQATLHDGSDLGQRAPTDQWPTLEHWRDSHQPAFNTLRGLYLLGLGNCRLLRGSLRNLGHNEWFFGSSWKRSQKG